MEKIIQENTYKEEKSMISGLNEFRILDLFCGAGGLSMGNA